MNYIGDVTFIVDNETFFDTRSLRNNEKNYSLFMFMGQNWPCLYI